jgi:hypothetical protein
MLFKEGAELLSVGQRKEAESGSITSSAGRVTLEADSQSRMRRLKEMVGPCGRF